MTTGPGIAYCTPAATHRPAPPHSCRLLPTTLVWYSSDEYACELPYKTMSTPLASPRTVCAPVPSPGCCRGHARRADGHVLPLATLPTFTHRLWQHVFAVVDLFPTCLVPGCCRGHSRRAGGHVPSLPCRAGRRQQRLGGPAVVAGGAHARGDGTGQLAGWVQAFWVGWIQQGVTGTARVCGHKVQGTAGWVGAGVSG